MAQPNDNQDEEIIDNEDTDTEDTDVETEGESDDDASTGTDDQEGSEEDSDDEDDGEDAGTGESADDDGEEDEDDIDEDEFVIPEKFKGKSAKDIVKSYINLEKQIDRRAQAIARKQAGGKRVVVPPRQDGAESDIENRIAKAFEGKDVTKMKPIDFAKTLGKAVGDSIEARAQEIARTTYETADTTKAHVQTEIDQTVKVYPQLKDNEGYRNMVVALIENEANQGKVLSLKAACQRVNKALGVKTNGAQDPAPKNDGAGKKKTGVERSGGSGGGDKQTDEEKVLSGLMGGKTSTTLGGLGI